MCKQDEKYNGWTNRETWLLALWFSDHLIEICSKFYVQNDRNVWETAKQVKDYFVDFIDEVYSPQILDEASFISDILWTSLDSINWTEIVESHLEDELITEG